MRYRDAGRRMDRVGRHPKVLRDFFGNVIEVGDRFFYATPYCSVGRVVKLRPTTLLLDIGANHRGANETMNVNSPMRGVCLNKIPQEWR